MSEREPEEARARELRARAAEAFRDVIRGDHLTYEQMEAHVERREDHRPHLDACLMCRDEVADLARAARVGEAHPRRWHVWLEAAAVALFVLGVVLVLHRPQAPQQARVRPIARPAVTAIAPPAVKAVEVPTLKPELAAVLRQLADGVLPSAKLVADLRPERERTRGNAGDDETLAIVAPLGVIEETQPHFRWTTRRGATYVAEVFDAAYRSIAHSDVLRDGTWHPTRPLARGVVYTWQVTETRGETSITAPAPPQPPARFRIIGKAAAAEVAAAGTPLARALIYAREGVVDRAFEEMRKERDPSPVVQRAMETLRRYQPAPTTTNPPQ